MLISVFCSNDGVADLANDAVAEDASALEERGASQPQLRVGVARRRFQNRAVASSCSVFDDADAVGSNNAVESDPSGSPLTVAGLAAVPSSRIKSARADAAAVVQDDLATCADRHPAASGVLMPVSKRILPSTATIPPSKIQRKIVRAT